MLMHQIENKEGTEFNKLKPLKETLPMELKIKCKASGFSKLAKTALGCMIMMCSLMTNSAHAAGENLLISSPYTTTSAPYAWETTTTVIANSGSTGWSGDCTNKLIDDDSFKVSFTGGFTFYFNAVPITGIKILSNGMIQLNQFELGWQRMLYGPVPYNSMPLSPPKSGCVTGEMELLAAPYFTDLDPTAGGNVSYQQKGTAPNRKFVISWNNLKLKNYSKVYTFQMVLNENGTILYQYQSGDWDNGLGKSMVVYKPSKYTLYSDNNTDNTYPRPTINNITNNSAVLFSPQSNELRFYDQTGTGSVCSGMDFVLESFLKGTATTDLNYTGTVKLSAASTANTVKMGDWEKVSGNGVFTPGPAGSGTATYTYVAADKGKASFKYRNSRAGAYYVKAEDQNNASSSDVYDFTMRFNDILLTPVNGIGDGTELVVGRPAQYRAEMWLMDPSDDSRCKIAEDYEGVKKTVLTYYPAAAHPAGAVSPQVSLNANCSASVASTNEKVSYDLNSMPFLNMNYVKGVSNFYICPSDIGKYALTIWDISKSYTEDWAYQPTGYGDELTIRPFALGIDSVKGTTSSTVNPGGTSSSGSKFVSAETPVSLKVSAYAYKAGQDTVTPGTPDSGVDLSSNALVPSYASNTQLSVASFTPAGGAAGVLGGSPIVGAGSFSGGQANVTNLTYAQAGSMSLRATSSNYLDSTITVPGVATSQIGRFYPHNLGVLTQSVTPACSTFTYMGQPALGLNFKLQAKGAAGTILTNYDAALYGGTTYLSSIKLAAVNSNAGVDLNASGTRIAWTAPSWSAGTFTSAQSVKFQRAATPDGPYDALQLGVWANAIDGENLASMDMNRSVSGTCSGAGCNTKAIGSPSSQRFGRFVLFNTYGSSQSQKLILKGQTQYWSNTGGWMPNTLDSCTNLPITVLARSLSDSAPPNIISYGTDGTGAVTAGKWSANVSPSSAGATGKIDFIAVLGASRNSTSCISSGTHTAGGASGANMPWLKGRYCSATSYDQDPAARVTFGNFNSTDGVISQREIY